MGKEFSIVPRQVARVETRYRRIITPLPHPDSVATLEALRTFEPQSMRGQPPLVWDRAEDIFVYDKYGNRWLDWSSGVLVANAGHSAPEICAAIAAQAGSGLLHNYCFPSEIRARLVEKLASHIRKEERELFEGMQRLMRPEELSIVGAALQQSLSDASNACILPTAATRLRPKQ